jgi:hypothetical protein
MGNIISAIVSGLNSVVSAIASVIVAIFSGIGRVLVAIWNFSESTIHLLIGRRAVYPGAGRIHGRTRSAFGSLGNDADV